jgi:glycosyltransferase involved in cell wall biosynthesis
MGQYLPALLGYPSPRILIEHEPGVETAQEFMDSPFARGRVRPLLDLLAWKRFEPSIIRKVDTVVVFTERDRKAIRDLGGKTPIVQIPFGTEISESSPNPQPLDALSLLFVGNFKHPPNLDAADRLINHIFPRVRAQIPEARLFIIGNHLPASLTHKANENLVVTGYVPDLTPYLNRAAVVVLPLRFGGGMRVKMLEALAAGKAVIASKRAVEGLDVMNGQQVILAEEDQEFVDAILDLLRNREKRSALAMNAHTWAVANLGWDKLAAVYEKLYRSLLKC